MNKSIIHIFSQLVDNYPQIIKKKEKGKWKVWEIFTIADNNKMVKMQRNHQISPSSR